jgi:hypothetical protein
MFLTKKKYVLLICVLCYVTCFGDLLILYFLGRRYPGYNQFDDTISSLGASVSPVSNLISAWWIIIGIVFIVFAIGFRIVYKEKGKIAKIAAMLIAIYGLGEGIGSGLFKADHVGSTLTIMAKIHNILGGFGILAMLLLPLIMQRIFPKESYHAFYILSSVIFFIGVLTTILFLTRYIDNAMLIVHSGLWQRLSLIDFYIYLLVIAHMMLKKSELMDELADMK